LALSTQDHSGACQLCTTLRKNKFARSAFREGSNVDASHPGQPSPFPAIRGGQSAVHPWARAEDIVADDAVEWAPRDLDKLIADPKEALDVFDFEPVMKKNVPPAHFGYMATGVDGD